MNVSRKEFLARGILSFGRELAAVFNVKAATLPEEPAGEVQGELLFYRQRCLGLRGGCFACIDHCPQEAVAIQPGVGIAVDAAKCNGCGDCVGICPVNPKAIAMNPLQGA